MTTLDHASNTRVLFRSGDFIEDRYRIVRKLADGGMGTVYLAEHVLIHRRVAIKLLHADLAAEGAMVRRFMNEASAAGTLGHPHIVESTDMGFMRNGIPYIVFEYLEGCLLSEEVYRLGGLPVRRALGIASQIASAMEAAHSAQIVHLDLKSDNVFLTHRGESVDHAKVLDFGISRFLGVDIERPLRGVLVGTPEFMAPEQVTMPDAVDGRADIYALGVLLYEMLTARCPHMHENPRVVLHQILHDPPPPLVRPVPRSLERLLFERLLIKSRDRRIQTMGEVKEALDEIAGRVRFATSNAELAAFAELDEGAGPNTKPSSEPDRTRAATTTPRAPASGTPGAKPSKESDRARNATPGTGPSKESDRARNGIPGTGPSKESDRARNGIPGTGPSKESHRARNGAPGTGPSREPDRAWDATPRRKPSTLPRMPPSKAIARSFSQPAVLPPMPLRRPRAWWLVAALLASLAGGALWFVEYQHIHAQLLAARDPRIAQGCVEGIPLALDGELKPAGLSLIATLAPTLRSDLLGDLGLASWALGAALLAIYVLGWVVYGIRAIWPASWSRRPGARPPWSVRACHSRPGRPGA